MENYEHIKVNKEDDRKYCKGREKYFIKRIGYKFFCTVSKIIKKHKLFFSIASLLIMILFVRFYLVGYSNEEVNSIYIQEKKVYDSNNNLERNYYSITGYFNNTYHKFKGYDVDIDDNKANIRIKSKLDLSGDSFIDFKIYVPEKVDTIMIDGKVVFQKGRNIPDKICEIFKDKNLDSFINQKFMKDDFEIIDTEDGYDNNSKYKSYYFKKREEIDDTFVRDNGNIVKKVDYKSKTVYNEDIINEQFRRYACLVLALDEKIEKVKWKYEINGQVITKEIDVEDACKIVGYNIKECINCEADLFDLFNVLFLTGDLYENK